MKIIIVINASLEFLYSICSFIAQFRKSLFIIEEDIANFPNVFYENTLTNEKI